MSNAIFCIASTQTIANQIVTRLKSEGFSDNDISVLFPDKSSTRDFAHEKNTKAPEGTAIGASTGGVIGGTLGLLAGIGLLAIPGVGPFIAAGPIMASLGGIGVGAAVGGITGALIGMGIPELEAKLYEDKVKDGNILISVHTDDSDEVDKVKDIFESENATDISKGSVSTAPDHDKGKHEDRHDHSDHEMNRDLNREAKPDLRTATGHGSFGSGAGTGTGNPPRAL